MFTIKTNIPELKKKILEEKKLVEQGFRIEFENLLKEVVEHVKALTPMSESSDRHVADGWTYKIFGGGKKGRAPVFGVIWNDFTHKRTGDPKARALLKTSKGKKDYTVLEVLEYGSPPHTIVPADKDVLRFDVDGDTVFARSVSHPGTPAYAMIRKTKLVLGDKLKTFVDNWAKRVIS